MRKHVAISILFSMACLASSAPIWAGLYRHADFYFDWYRLSSSSTLNEHHVMRLDAEGLTLREHVCPAAVPGINRQHHVDPVPRTGDPAAMTHYIVDRGLSAIAALGEQFRAIFTFAGSRSTVQATR